MDILCCLKTTIEKFDLTFKTSFPCNVEEHKKISHKLKLICDGRGGCQWAMRGVDPSHFVMICGIQGQGVFLLVKNFSWPLIVWVVLI
jgi:hypothetical protein